MLSAAWSQNGGDSSSELCQQSRKRLYFRNPGALTSVAGSPSTVKCHNLDMIHWQWFPYPIQPHSQAGVAGEVFFFPAGEEQMGRER